MIVADLMFLNLNIVIKKNLTRILFMQCFLLTNYNQILMTTTIIRSKKKLRVKSLVNLSGHIILVTF